MSRLKISSEYAAITRSPLTRDFKHLTAPTKLNGYSLSPLFREPNPGVRVHDRIKHWNIVPGDKVRIINGPNADKETVRQVASINKLTNKVYIKGLAGKGKQSLKAEQYSNLQLLVGKFKVTAEGAEKSKVHNVWATRLSTSKPFFHKDHGVWIWNRYAASTSIPLPKPAGPDGTVLAERKNRIRIPWPSGEKKDPAAKPGPHDTLPEDATAITWTPFHPQNAVDFTTLEHLYIRSLHPGQSFFNPTPRDGDDNQLDSNVPMEHFLAAELSNPHSRSKKQKRWQERQKAKEVLKEQFIARELERAQKTGPGTELGGRRVKASEAKAIATWKWKNELLKQATNEKQRRWVARGGLENKKRRQERSKRKVRRQQERLRQLVLVEEKNQVIPQPTPPQRQSSA